MIQRLATGGILNRPRPENPGGSVAGYAGAVLTDYLSIAFSSPHGAMHRANALPRDTAGAYEIVAFSNDLDVEA